MADGAAGHTDIDLDPKCPGCGVKPCRMNITPGYDPERKFFLIQVTCFNCHVLLPVLVAPLTEEQRAQLLAELAATPPKGPSIVRPRGYPS